MNLNQEQTKSLNMKDINSKQNTTDDILKSHNQTKAINNQTIFLSENKAKNKSVEANKT